MLFTASRMVLRPLASPARAGMLRRVGGRLQIKSDRLSRPKAGRDASGGLAPARRAASAPGRGRRAARRRSLLVVAFVPGSPSRRRLTEADRPGGVKPHRRRCGPAAFGLTPPVRSAWLRPPTRRGTRDNPTCVEDPRATRCAGCCCTGRGHVGAPDHRVVAPRSDSDPRAVVATPTGGRQRDRRRSTELRHPPGHRREPQPSRDRMTAPGAGRRSSRHRAHRGRL